MDEHKNYAAIPLAAISALAGDAAADFEIRLPHPGGATPTLYRKSGADLDLPDYRRMREHGVTHLYVPASDLSRCEAILEGKLTSLLNRAQLSPAEKAGIMHEVGASVARDLTLATGPGAPGPDLDRVANVVDNVIGCVLHDPVVATHMLQMAEHERTVASHMFIVSALAVLFGAEYFGDDPEMLRAFGFAGMMHDLGKLTIGAAILNKTEPLTAQEIHLIEQHPVESVRLIGEAPQVTPLVRQMILQHHERVDGKGYPVGVCGNNLPSTSRMLSIVDSFHAMIGHRPYRAPLTAVEATRVLNSHAGKQFDADLLACWNGLFGRCWTASSTVPQRTHVPEDCLTASRNEHRVAPPRRSLHSRVTRAHCKGNLAIRCLYAGRLPRSTDAPNEFVAPVRDLSRRGLCIYTAHPLFRGEVLHVQLTAGARETWVRGTVAWCRQQGDNSYRAGLRLSQRLTEGQIRTSVPVEELPGPLRPRTQESSPATALPQISTSLDSTPEAPDAVKVMNALRTIQKIGARKSLDVEDERTVIVLSMSADAEVRCKAIDVLARMDSRAAREAILSLLKDAEPAVRERAAATAGAIRLGEAGCPLRLLLNDPVESVTLRAAGALGRLGDSKGLPLVVSVLRAKAENARLAAAVLGDIVGHRFPANAEGVRIALRYVEAHDLVASGEKRVVSGE